MQNMHLHEYYLKQTNENYSYWRKHRDKYKVEGREGKFQFSKGW